MRRRAGIVWRRLQVLPRIGVVVLGLAFAALALLFVLKWAPELLAQPGLADKDRAAEVGRTRTAVLATLAGMIAIAGAIFTGLSYRLNRAGQITERFTRAIDQLGATDESGKSKIDVVLGGIYALERIARDSKDDHPQVVEVLTAYVREHAPYGPGKRSAATTSTRYGQGDEATPGPDEAPPLATDIQAAMDVLARRDVTQDRPNHRLNLAGTDLRRLVLDAGEGGHLENANLVGANLGGASLLEAHFEGAYLSEAHLEKASFSWAHLENAYLDEAHLEGANLLSAHLQGAVLHGAHLEDAVLAGAHLEGANLHGAHLEGANLEQAQLEKATLFYAQLEDAKLERARYDDLTRWPRSDFETEARARGARHVDDDDEDRSAETD